MLGMVGDDGYGLETRENFKGRKVGVEDLRVGKEQVMQREGQSDSKVTYRLPKQLTTLPALASLIAERTSDYTGRWEG